MKNFLDEMSDFVCKKIRYKEHEQAVMNGLFFILIRD